MSPRDREVLRASSGLNPANGPTEKWRLRTAPLLTSVIATELFPMMLVAVAEVCVAWEFLAPLW